MSGSEKEYTQLKKYSITSYNNYVVINFSIMFAVFLIKWFVVDESIKKVKCPIMLLKQCIGYLMRNIKWNLMSRIFY